ncbi:MAG: hypothetical protein R3321_11335 [Nitrososphaeraceae archaeon]|nr:hypothetical protein [Nitrososphaeraceae archaeon]
MKQVLVITAQSESIKYPTGQNIIGVAETMEQALSLIEKYFGYYEEISHAHVSGSSIECIKSIVEYNYSRTVGNKVQLVFEWFQLNCA